MIHEYFFRFENIHLPIVLIFSNGFIYFWDISVCNNWIRFLGWVCPGKNTDNLPFN